MTRQSIIYCLLLTALHILSVRTKGAIFHTHTCLYHVLQLTRDEQEELYMGIFICRAKQKEEFVLTIITFFC